jgi:hypothetical protein
MTASDAVKFWKTDVYRGARVDLNPVTDPSVTPDLSVTP